MAVWNDILGNLFGFELTPKTAKQKAEEQKPKTFGIPQEDDGAVVVQTGAYYGMYQDLDGAVRNEVELISKYREMAMQPEMEAAIDDIVNESIVAEDSGNSVSINADDLETSDGIKDKIDEEFKNILRMLNFGNMGHDIFKRWYIDGRLFYHVIVDEEKRNEGIQEVKYIDPRRIRKIRQIEKAYDPQTGMEMVKRVKEYYLYNERGIIGIHSNMGAKISVDSIVNVNSGLMDAKRTMVLSYLHKAIKPWNNLRQMEDAVVINRVARASERRIFYVDVGTMATIKAEQYVQALATRYKNKIVYDSQTGDIKDDRKYQAMTEDYFLPRREGGKGTEISTLPGAQNLGDIEDVKYFERKLYKALNVPISRLEPTTGFTLGRSQEISRDELKFAKFVSRLRNRFAILFDELMKTQLVLKNICTEEEWKEIREQVWYDFLKDNNFDELKEAELTRDRLSTLALLDPYVGRYFSMEWVRKNVLQLTEEDIKEMKEQMDAETEENAAKGLDPAGAPLPPPPYPGVTDGSGQPLPPPPGGQPPAPQDQGQPPADPNNGIPGGQAVPPSASPKFALKPKKP